MRKLSFVFFAWCAAATPSFAGPIVFDEWLEFGFADAGTLATGCDPADPTGNFCVPSSGTSTTFLDTPAWTFTAPASGATLRVTDAFLSGDRFQIFDFGVSLGLTSLPVPGTDCGDDPVPCFAAPDISTGIFFLTAGSHSLTLLPTLAPSGSGAGYLRVEAGGAPTLVPEPATATLLATGLGLCLFRRRRARG